MNIENISTAELEKQASQLAHLYSLRNLTDDAMAYVLDAYAIINKELTDRREKSKVGLEDAKILVQNILGNTLIVEVPATIENVEKMFT